jgi:hypothetical protein
MEWIKDADDAGFMFRYVIPLVACTLEEVHARLLKAEATVQVTPLERSRTSAPQTSQDTQGF